MDDIDRLVAALARAWGQSEAYVRNCFGLKK